MSFFRNLFNQAAKIDQLSRNIAIEQRKVDELEYLLNRSDSLYKLLEKRCETLETEVEKARKSEMRTLRHHADIIGKSVKVQSSFKAINEEAIEQPKPEIDPAMEDKIMWAAEQMRAEDIRNNIRPSTVESYAEVIRENPSEYII